MIPVFRRTVLGGIALWVLFPGGWLGALPSWVDNSSLPCFPPIRDQNSATGSCIPWATSYYNLGYMTAKERGWDIRSLTNTNQQFSPEWTYNFNNGGQNVGTSDILAVDLLKTSGVAPWSDLPYVAFEVTKWATNGGAYRRALAHRIVDVTNIYFMDTATGRNAVKQKLYEGSVLYLGLYSTGLQWTRLTNDPSTTADDPWTNEWVVDYSRTGGGHCVSIVGYNDDVWCDINRNGVVDTNEKGAWKIANSEGSTFKNNGFFWIAYDAMGLTSSVVPAPTGQSSRIELGQVSNRGVALEVRPVYAPKVVAEFTLSHLSRNQLNVYLGLGSVSNNDTAPTVTWAPSGRVLQVRGGAYAFDGTGVEKDATFCMDFTDLVSNAGPDTRWFLSMIDTATGSNLTFRHFKLYECGSGTDLLVGSNTNQGVFDGPAVFHRYIDWPYTPSTGNTPPTIAPISGFSAPTNAPIVLPFTASDAQTALPGLSFRMTSSDPSIIPNGSVVYDRSGANPVATITPRVGAAGNVTLTLRVTDALGLWAETTVAVALTNQTFTNPVPQVTASHGSLVTNAPFTLTLTADRDGGRVSTNGSNWGSFATTTNLTIHGAVTVWTFGRDAWGNTSATNQRVFGWDGTAPTVTGLLPTQTTNGGFILTLGVDEPWGQVTTNGGTSWITFSTQGLALPILTTTTVSVFGRDNLGNTGATNTAVYTIPAPVVTVDKGDLVTNQAFNLTLTTSRPNGQVSTNGTDFLPFPAVTNLVLDRATTVWTRGVDTNGVTGAVQSNVYRWDTTPPVVTGLGSGFSTNRSFSVAVGLSEGRGYLSTNEGGSWSEFTTSGTNLEITGTTTVWAFGRDDAGNVGATNRATWVFVPFLSGTAMGNLLAEVPQAEVQQEIRSLYTSAPAKVEGLLAEQTGGRLVAPPVSLPGKPVLLLLPKVSDGYVSGEIKILDRQGRTIARWTHPATSGAVALWSKKDSNGQKVRNGMYVVELVSGGRVYRTLTLVNEP